MRSALSSSPGSGNGSGGGLGSGSENGSGSGNQQHSRGNNTVKKHKLQDQGKGQTMFTVVMFAIESKPTSHRDCDDC